MSLNPPQTYRKTRNIHRRGLASARPLPIDVLAGTLYYSTDTGVTERSNGLLWETYSIANTVMGNTDTGVQISWNPGINGNTFIEWNGINDLVIHGLVGGVSGQRVTIKHAGFLNTTIYVPHYSLATAAANRFFNFATSGWTPVGFGGSVTYIYDGATWMLVTHEQGIWITSTYSAANFGTNGAMVWTVNAGDISYLRWRLSGRTMTVSFKLINTDLSGPVTNGLAISNNAWGGFTVAGDTASPAALVAQSGVVLQNVIVEAVTTTIYLVYVPGNYAVDPDTQIWGMHTFEVT